MATTLVINRERLRESYFQSMQPTKVSFTGEKKANAFIVTNIVL